MKGHDVRFQTDLTNMQAMYAGNLKWTAVICLRSESQKVLTSGNRYPACSFAKLAFLFTLVQTASKEIYGVGAVLK